MPDRTTFDRQPTAVPALLERDRMFSHDAEGNAITRTRTCECGRRFTQRLLSARFLEIVEGQSKGALAAVRRDIPDYFVPVHCPPCERRDLGHAARRADFRRTDQEAAD